MALPNNVPRTHFGRVGASVLPPVPFGLRRQVAGEGDGDSAGCFLMLCAVLRGCCRWECAVPFWLEGPKSLTLKNSSASLQYTRREKWDRREREREREKETRLCLMDWHALSRLSRPLGGSSSFSKRAHPPEDGFDHISRAGCHRTRSRNRERRRRRRRHSSDRREDNPEPTVDRKRKPWR